MCVEIDIPFAYNFNDKYIVCGKINNILNMICVGGGKIYWPIVEGNIKLPVILTGPYS